MSSSLLTRSFSGDPKKGMGQSLQGGKGKLFLGKQGALQWLSLATHSALKSAIISVIPYGLGSGEFRHSWTLWK